MEDYKKHTLSCGITVVLSSLGLQPIVLAPETKYVTLAYTSRTIGFYLNLKGVWLQEDQIQEYLDELMFMKKALKEANEFLKEQSNKENGQK